MVTLTGILYELVPNGNQLILSTEADHSKTSLLISSNIAVPTAINTFVSCKQLPTGNLEAMKKVHS